MRAASRTVIRVLRSQRGGGFSCKLVKFTGGHAIVQAFDGKLGNDVLGQPNWFQSCDECSSISQGIASNRTSSLSPFLFTTCMVIFFPPVLQLCDCAVSSLDRVRFKSLRQQRSAVGRFQGDALSITPAFWYSATRFSKKLVLPCMEIISIQGKGLTTL